MTYVFHIPIKYLLFTGNGLIYEKHGPSFIKELDEFITDNNISIKRLYYTKEKNLPLQDDNNLITQISFKNFSNRNFSNQYSVSSRIITGNKTDEDIIKKTCFSIKRNQYREEYEIEHENHYVVRFNWYMLIYTDRECIALKLFI